MRKCQPSQDRVVKAVINFTPKPTKKYSVNDIGILDTIKAKYGIDIIVEVHSIPAIKQTHKATLIGTAKNVKIFLGDEFLTDPRYPVVDPSTIPDEIFE
jgi:hypothetical protein